VIPSPKSVTIVAGEASGDLHASHLIQALKTRIPTISITGMGGPAMQAAGAKLLVDASKVAVVGITEVLAKASNVIKAMSTLKQLLRDERPDLLILIDFPDFNLHLAGAAKRMGIPVLYYISPQIWAWRSGRVKKIKKRVDHMAVILPFEKQFYERYGVPVTFVGHPLMDSVGKSVTMSNTRSGSEEAQTVALVPGSRDREVASLLPVMLQAAEQLSEKIASVRFIVSCAPSIVLEMIESIIAQHNLNNVTVSRAPVSEIFSSCNFAVVASGTVTLEAAICGTPMAIAYAVSPLSYWLGRALIDVDHIGLVNLIAQARIVPELVQKEVTPEAICKAIIAVLSDPAADDRVRKQLAIVRKRLGAPGASDKVARIAVQLMGANHAV